MGSNKCKLLSTLFRLYKLRGLFRYRDICGNSISLTLLFYVYYAHLQIVRHTCLSCLTHTDHITCACGVWSTFMYRWDNTLSHHHQKWAYISTNEHYSGFYRNICKKAYVCSLFLCVCWCMLNKTHKLLYRSLNLYIYIYMIKVYFLFKSMAVVA